MSDLSGGLTSLTVIVSSSSDQHAHAQSLLFAISALKGLTKKFGQGISELVMFWRVLFLPGVPQCRQESSKERWTWIGLFTILRNSITPLAGRLQGGKREFIAGGVCSGEKKPLVYHIPLKAIVFFFSEIFSHIQCCTVNVIYLGIKWLWTCHYGETLCVLWDSIPDFDDVSYSRCGSRTIVQLKLISQESLLGLWHRTFVRVFQVMNSYLS